MRVRVRADDGEYSEGSGARKEGLSAKKKRVLHAIRTVFNISEAVIMVVALQRLNADVVQREAGILADFVHLDEGAPQEGGGIGTEEAFTKNDDDGSVGA